MNKGAGLLFKKTEVSKINRIIVRVKIINIIEKI